MKFWRHSLLATIAFIAVSISVVYTSSCTDDPCLRLKCRHNATCVDGYCKCPIGWEGHECISRATDRYVGFYEGTIIINGHEPIIDSAIIAYGPDSVESYSATAFTFKRFTRPDDVITGHLNADGKVTTITDGNFGGRTITIIEENEKISFTSIEKPNGVEQTIKFVGTKTRDQP